VLALRKAKDKSDSLGKEYTVKDVRQMVDKTKRSQIEACKLAERNNKTLKTVADYRQGQVRLQNEQAEASKASLE